MRVQPYIAVSHHHQLTLSKDGDFKKASWADKAVWFLSAKSHAKDQIAVLKALNLYRAEHRYLPVKTDDMQALDHALSLIKKRAICTYQGQLYHRENHTLTKITNPKLVLSWLQ